MLRAIAHSRATEGFTLIEVLIALAIVAVSLSAIGAVIATSVRGARSIERRLSQIETARWITTALPDRDQLLVGSLQGEIAAHRWRIDTSPFIANFPAPPSTLWVPQAVVVTVQSSYGGALQIETVRLHQRFNR